jgi:hypothetical protein
MLSGVKCPHIITVMAEVVQSHFLLRKKLQKPLIYVNLTENNNIRGISNRNKVPLPIFGFEINSVVPSFECP